MNHGLSDQVRKVAIEKYVLPAIHTGKERFSVAVRDLMQHLEPLGFPVRNWPQICTAIQAEKFLRANGLEIEAVDGPPKRQSSTVVVRYRIANRSARANLSETQAEESPPGASREETPEQWAHRMTGKLFGLMKDEIASIGGAEAFIRWVRSEDEDEVA